MFPLRDENPTFLTPVVTYVLIGLNVLVWIVLQQGGMGAGFLSSLCGYGAIPADITGAIEPGSTILLAPDLPCTVGNLGWLTILTSMFMHGSWMHLIGNMWFLWVFGNNIEDSMGHVRFVAFYLICGVLASLAHVVSAPDSAIPTVGASGAISGVMGAYLVLYPKVKVQTLFFFVIIVRIFYLPAWVLLIEWLVIQVFSGVTQQTDGAGVAFWAHIGGFVAGVALIKLFERKQLVEAKVRHETLSPQQLHRLRW